MRLVRQALGPEIGQCCGGHVTFQIERASRETSRRLCRAELEEMSRRHRVPIYGAGHVGRALALALDPLPFKTLVVDTRQEEIDAVIGDNVERLCGNCVPMAEKALKRVQVWRQELTQLCGGLAFLHGWSPPAGLRRS